jgi:arsenate reductase (thioredoxin)
MKLLPALHQTVQELEHTFDQIPNERKTLLRQLSDYIREKQHAGGPVNLVFICTHNSRRSHMAQLWAQAAGAYYGIGQVQCFSGGTEATAFNPRAVEAMRELGFDISPAGQEANPIYQVRFAAEAAPVRLWSKTFDDPANPATGFGAVMTCSDADENCPLVPGVERRLAITYDDPKHFDDTPQETEKYRERARQIGRELLYAFKEARKSR